MHKKLEIKTATEIANELDYIEEEYFDKYAHTSINKIPKEANEKIDSAYKKRFVAVETLKQFIHDELVRLKGMLEDYDPTDTAFLHIQGRIRQCEEFFGG